MFNALIILFVTIKATNSNCTNNNWYDEFTNGNIFCSKPTSEDSLPGKFSQRGLINECEIPNKQFRCETLGSFPDYTDQTCASYFVCTKYSDGTWIQNRYKCSNSKFNPTQQLCSKEYVCPCNPTDIDTTCKLTEEEFNCTTAGRFADLSDPTCKNYFLCSTLHNGTILKTPYTCRGSTFDSNLHKCSSEYICPCLNVTTVVPTEATSPLPCADPSPGYVFSCENSGRFADVYDKTCAKYFLCSKLRNGTFIKTEYTCLKSSFNPLLGRCVENYDCPCLTETTKPATEVTKPVTEATKPATEVPKPTSQTTKPPTEATKSPTEETSSLPCPDPSPGYVFYCEESGRFQDVYDKTCSKYFLCTKLRNGTFLQTPYTCLRSSFNPSLGRCVENYHCPCLNETTTGPTEATKALTELTKPPSETTKPQTEATKPPSESTKPPIEATTSPTEATSPPLCPDPSPGYVFYCEEGGRFQDLYDKTCSKYFLCTKLRNGTFLQTPYTCQKSSFNPLLGRCVENYDCPCLNETTKPLTEITKPATETTKPATEVPKPPSETTKPPTEATKSPTEATSPLPCSDPSPGYVFSCENSGRFADVYDKTCAKYFLCTKLRNGTFIQTPYTCLKSYFNPLVGRCVENYDCPCLNETTIGPTEAPKPPTETAKPPTEAPKPSSESTKPTSGTTKPPTEATKPPTEASKPPTKPTSLPPCTAPSPGYVFNCEKGGRFADIYDKTCAKYFLCTKLRNGTFIQTPYTCQKSSFNPLLGRCVENYYCPCSSEATKTTIRTTHTTESLTTTSPITTTPFYDCDQTNAEPSNFNCLQTGRFPDYSDLSCRRYFLCSHLKNGTFIKSSYQCPISTCLNNTLHKCSSQCRCPCLK